MKTPVYYVVRGRVKSTVMCQGSDDRVREVMRVFSHYVALRVAGALTTAFNDGLHWPPPKAK